MAFYIKVVDTNFNEHKHFITDPECIKYDLDNSGRFTSSGIYTEDMVRDAIDDLALSASDCGFDDVDEDEIISQHMNYHFDVEEYIEEMCFSPSAREKQKIDSIISILKEKGFIGEYLYTFEGKRIKKEGSNE